MLNFLLFCVVVLIIVAVCFLLRVMNHGLWRKILYKMHLWLGIISGLVLFIVCLTGTLLVFERDIIKFWECDKYFVSYPNKLPLNIDDLVAKVEQNTNSKVCLVAMPNHRIDTTMSYIVVIKKENSKNTETERNVRYEDYMIDPYTGEMLGKRVSPLRNFFIVITKLHTSLFLPSPIGKFVVGSATLIFVVIVLSGLCLWLPINFCNKKSWTNGLLIRFRKGKNQLLFDLHKTLGFYALIPILLMALTGLAWSFQWYNKGVQMIFHAESSSNHRIKSSPKNSDARRLPLDFFDKKADEMLAPNKGGFRMFFIPDNNDDSVMVIEYRQGMLQLAADDKIQFDQYTGEALQFDHFENIPLGTKIISLFPVLHYGRILGLPTKIIFFLACLIATTLPITGVIIWWRKLRKIRKNEGRK
ncbi:MAG: PepSY domain-containing protein [Prevotellaceae bacterium]|jgi:uncharacterized iron-regulated membrane protein|nr:PepSY domain-containing protein [Prevotellaceae bacterium]